MERTVVGVFDSSLEAQDVRKELTTIGVPEDRLHVEAGGTDTAATRTRETHDEGLFERIVHWFEGEDEHAGEYAEAVRRGSFVLVADGIDEDSVDQVAEIMSRHGAIDVDKRVSGWRERGWTGYDASAPALSDEDLRRERDFATQRAQPAQPVQPGRATSSAASPAPTASSAGGTTQRIPVVEEELKVGKRVVNRGGVRIHTRMTERPVEEEVTLREERARVERRDVDRPATAADMAQAFKEGAMEVRETAEEPVVSKQARVVGEVEVGKEVSEQTRKVQDTVRRSDVQVENLSGTGARQTAYEGAGTRDMAPNAAATAGTRATAGAGATTGTGAMAGAGAVSGTSANVAGGANMDVDDLNRVLRDELSAVETYRQALDKNRNAYGQDARFQQLVRMLEDHERAASQLRDMIRQRGGTASTDSGAWGTWANTVMGTAKLFGDAAALKALKEGEESGIKDYQSMLDDGAPQDVRNTFTEIMSREQNHVRELDQLIDRA